MQVFYTYVDNVLDRKNKRESYFYASFLNCGVLIMPRAPGDATVLKRFCAITLLLFVFSWWSRDHFSAPFRGLYPQTLHTSKRLTFRVSAFHRYHWFGVKLFPVGCAHDSRRLEGTLKRDKCSFWIWLRPRYKIRRLSFSVAQHITEISHPWHGHYAN